MRAIIFTLLAVALWIGSVVAWSQFADATSDLDALGPNASNAEIYPIENRQLTGFALGMTLSLLAIVFGGLAGRNCTRNRDL